MPKFANSRSLLARAALLGVVALTLLVPAMPVAAATGPYLVKDINTSGSSSPSWLTPIGDILYFSAKGGAKGRELWRSDGTAPGTKRVKDIYPGTTGSSPDGLTEVGGLLYFAANDGINGRELWVSDGTTAGTHLVKSIRSGATGSDPSNLTAIGGFLYFSADDGVTGRELWRTDGTSEGTTRVKDVTPGPDGTQFIGMFLLGPIMFFTVYNPVLGEVALWKSYGSAATTKPFYDMDGERIRGDIHSVAVVGPRLFFSYNGDLWRSAGKPANTKKIADVELCCEGITGVGSTAYFSDGGSGSLWASDGTPATTRIVKDVPPSDMVDVNGTLFFFVPDDQPWTSDGTTAGTQPVGKKAETEGALAALGSVLYFGGWSFEEELSPTTAPTGGSPSFVPAPTTTLSRTDGTAEGTYPIQPENYGNMGEMVAVGDSVFFVTNGGGYGFELWRYVP